MIHLLTPDQISPFWPAIKHAVKIANRLEDVDEARYTTHLLPNLLNYKAQCWVGVKEVGGSEVVYGLGITTIEETPLGEVYLLLHTLYALSPIPDEDMAAFVPLLEKFCRNSGCTKMVCYTYNNRLVETFISQGFSQDVSLWVKQLGGG